VWFLQNDDHVFIDTSEDVFQEGLERMAADGSPHVTMYPSHWTEILKLSGKVESPQVCGSYVKVPMTLSDGLQVMNFKHMRYLLDDLDWKGMNFTRMDDVALDPRLIGDPTIWEDSAQSIDPNIAHLQSMPFFLDQSIQTMYIPLREICRKFDGYQGVIDQGKVPWLVLPPENNTFDRSYHGLVSMLTGPTTKTGWCRGNSFQIPVEYFLRIFELYHENGTPSTTDCMVIGGTMCAN